ncbi:MAG: FAD-dependent oxidoreductase [Bacteroidales bacterium]|nr:FAD-dependent oxidoreductase [Bacteroidales bacterium]
MSRIAIIGAGISGLTAAKSLMDSHEITVYEKSETAGGLAQSVKADGCVFHICGANSMKNISEKTHKFIEGIIDFGDEIIELKRNSAILFENGEVSKPEFHGMFKKKMTEIEGVPSPIENHIYMFKPEIQQRIIADIFRVKNREKNKRTPKFLATYFKAKFGQTLYDMYFGPYNEKVWHSDLRKIPLRWLEGRLSAPTADQMIFANFNHDKSKFLCEKTFLYDINGGAQRLVNRLVEILGDRLRLNHAVECIEHSGGKWIVDGEKYDQIVYCANLKLLPKILHINEIKPFGSYIDTLKYHGTTSVFCELSKNPYTEIYLPGKEHRAHKIICTGNFADTNNNDTHKMTGTVEFTDYVSEDEIKEELSRMPLNPIYITHRYTEYTHAIQDIDTHETVEKIKSTLRPMGFYMTGLFAEWVQYNVNQAINAAINTVESMHNELNI